MNHLPLEPLACLEVWLLGYVRLVLLSIVDQALFCNFFVYMFLSLFSGDANDDCQWKYML
jgi:hypothetical protein